MPSAGHDSLRALQSSINASIDDYVKAATRDGNNTAKLANLQRSIASQAARIQAEVADPVLRVLELSFAPAVGVATRVAIYLDLFNVISDEGIHVDKLLERTAADKNVVLRMLRTLASANIISQTSQGVYAATPFSKALAVPHMRDFFILHFDVSNPKYYHMPSHLKKTNFKDPTVDSNVSLEINGYYYNALARDPNLQALFDSAMQIQSYFSKETIPQYPFQSETSNVDSKHPFIIDIGGGRGQFLTDLLKDQPNLPGRFILQDFPSVIDDVKSVTLPERIEVMAYDAVKEDQPIQGAKFYYFRRVFHGWDDGLALKALEKVKEGMKRGYSKLLIQDEVMPDLGCDVREACQDLNMMIVAAMERSEGQWRELLKKGGFKTIRIVMAEVGSFGIIEAEVDE